MNRIKSARFGEQRGNDVLSIKRQWSGDRKTRTICSSPFLRTTQMKNRFAIASALVLTLVSGPVLANQAHAVLQKMPDQKRQEIFAGLLKNNKQECGSVTRTFLQGSDKDGNAYWNVGCRSQKAFLIRVNNDSRGSTKVLDCAVMKAMRGGECFKKF